MLRNNFFHLFLAGLCCFSCQKSFDSEAKLLDYINDGDNGYKYSKSVNGVNYDLVYYPTDLLVYREIGNVKPTDDSLKQLRAKYGQYMYFSLSMNKNGRELLSHVSREKEKFGQMLNELAFGIDKNIYMYTPQKDTLEMIDFVYPRMYGMSGNTSVMVVFKRDEEYIGEDLLHFTVGDMGMQTGEIKFKINTRAIKEEAQLNF